MMLKRTNSGTKQVHQTKKNGRRGYEGEEEREIKLKDITAI